MNALRAALTGVLAGMLSAAACGPLPSPATSTLPGATATVAPAPPRSAVPSATSAALLEIADLPPVDPDAATLTAICDPDPNQLHPDIGETRLFCFDAIAIGIRVVRAVTDATSRRAYLLRPTCAEAPCPTSLLQTATVVVWTDAGTFAVQIDATLETVAVPESNVSGPWPFAGLFTSPAAKLGSLPAAPAAIAARSAYPYCGRASNEVPLEVFACFRNSVVSGKRAEAVIVSFGTEGNEVIDLFRFDGVGAITRYQWSAGDWVHERGGMILGPREGTWSFDPWGSGEAVH